MYINNNINIAAHPNLKLFITHGGQLSTTEAIYYGVPILGIPVMADQNVNMKSVEEKGFGIGIEISDDVAIHLEVALKKMLSNPLLVYLFAYTYLLLESGPIILFVSNLIATIYICVF